MRLSPAPSTAAGEEGRGGERRGEERRGGEGRGEERRGGERRGEEGRGGEEGEGRGEEHKINGHITQHSYLSSRNSCMYVCTCILLSMLLQQSCKSDFLDYRILIVCTFESRLRQLFFFS